MGLAPPIRGPPLATTLTIGTTIKAAANNSAINFVNLTLLDSGTLIAGNATSQSSNTVSNVFLGNASGTTAFTITGTAYVNSNGAFSTQNQLFLNPVSGSSFNGGISQANSNNVTAIVLYDNFGVAESASNSNPIVNTAYLSATSGNERIAGTIDNVAAAYPTATTSVAEEMLGNRTTLSINGTSGGVFTYAGVISDEIKEGNTTQGAAGSAPSTAATNNYLQLSKSGTNTQILSGANTFGGGTAITGGILAVTNTAGSGLGTGAVAVSGTSATVFGTLSGGSGTTLAATAGGATLPNYVASTNGTISGAVTVGQFGHLAPGITAAGVLAPNTLTVGMLTLASGAVMDYQFSSTANSFTSVTAVGALTLNSGISVNLYQSGTTNAFGAAGIYNLIGYTGAVTGFAPAEFTVANIIAGDTYSFSNDTTDGLIQLTVTAVPEPSTWVLAGLMALTCGCQLYRRSRQARV